MIWKHNGEIKKQLKKIYYLVGEEKTYDRITNQKSIRHTA